jgi:hypothetical protein
VLLAELGVDRSAACQRLGLPRASCSGSRSGIYLASDGTAGGVEEGSMTLPLCTELVDAWVLIEEPEICSALRFMIDTEHQLIEGQPRWPSRQD